MVKLVETVKFAPTSFEPTFWMGPVLENVSLLGYNR